LFIKFVYDDRHMESFGIKPPHPTFLFDSKNNKTVTSSTMMRERNYPINIIFRIDLFMRQKQLTQS